MIGVGEDDYSMGWSGHMEWAHEALRRGQASFGARLHFMYHHCPVL